MVKKGILFQKKKKKIAGSYRAEIFCSSFLLGSISETNSIRRGQASAPAELAKPKARVLPRAPGSKTSLQSANSEHIDLGPAPEKAATLSSTAMVSTVTTAPAATNHTANQLRPENHHVIHIRDSSMEEGLPTSPAKTIVIPGASETRRLPTAPHDKSNSKLPQEPSKSRRSAPSHSRDNKQQSSLSDVTPGELESPWVKHIDEATGRPFYVK